MIETLIAFLATRPLLTKVIVRGVEFLIVFVCGIVVGCRGCN